MSEHRGLTVFGQALCDLFVSLVIFNLVLAAVFATSYVYARGVDLMACRPDNSGGIDPVACIAALRASAQPSWLTIGSRSAIAAAAVLVIGTSFGTAWEMGRARTGPRMVVHVPPGEDRVVYEGPERRTGRDRRKGAPQ